MLHFLYRLLIRWPTEVVLLTKSDYRKLLRSAKGGTKGKR